MPLKKNKGSRELTCREKVQICQTAVPIPQNGLSIYFYA